MAGHLSSRLRVTFKVSVIDAVFATVFAAIAAPGSVFLTKMANEHGASPMMFSLLSCTGAVAAILAPLGVAITKNMTSRKRTVVVLTSIGRAMVLPIGLLPFLFTSSIVLHAFITLLFLSICIQTIAANAWTGWIADSVPITVRGRFFSVRSQYSMIAGLATGFLFSIFIDLYDKDPGSVATFLKGIAASTGILSFDSENLKYVFLTLFAAAGVIGVAGSLILLRQPERPKKLESEPFGKMLVGALKDKNFIRLMLYGFWWALAVGIGAPFWQPYMLNNLQMSLTEMQVYGLFSNIAAITAIRFWGKFIDLYGNKTAMTVCVIMGGINPIIWIFASGPSTKWIVFCEAVTSGTMWSGAGVIASNFVLSISPRGQSQMYAGIYGAFTGIAVMTTSLLSGIFIPPANMSFIGLDLSPEQVLFGFGGVVRWTALIPLFFVREPLAKSVGFVVSKLLGNAKVHIFHIFGIFRKTRKPD